MYAKDAELTELCRVVASYGGYYCPHHRSYGAGALQAYEEMVELTREADCPLHLAHATMNFGVNKGRAPELLTLLDDALAAGADITLDTYPYTPGCTTLVALLPSWGTRAARSASWSGSRTTTPPSASGTTWRRPAPTAATACPWSGRPSRSPAPATRPSPSTSAARSWSRRGCAARVRGRSPGACC